VCTVLTMTRDLSDGVGADEGGIARAGGRDEGRGAAGLRRDVVRLLGEWTCLRTDCAGTGKL
jgi:hypothetical protein